MILFLGVSLTEQQTSKMCLGCKEDSESLRNVMLKMSSLRVMVKRSRGKKQLKKIEKKQHVVVTENNLFKAFTAEGVRNYDQK